MSLEKSQRQSSAQEKGQNKRPWGLLTAGMIGVILLTALGAWQLYRLEWKRNLILNIETGIAGNPVHIADAEAGLENGYDVDWLKVTATGRFRHDHERHVFAIRGKQVGWNIITPLVKQSDYIVLVNRGFVPEDRKERDSRPEPDHSEVTITGFVRVEPDQASIFSPEPDPQANRWYWFDLIGIMQSLPETVIGDLSLPPPRGMPFAVQLSPFEPEEGYLGPIPAPVSANIRNNHLGYAITWFSLAVILAGMTFLYIRRRPR